MRLIAALLTFASFSLSAAPSFAGPILDRIKAAGVVRCGGVDRPGLVQIEPDGKAHGLDIRSYPEFDGWYGHGTIAIRMTIPDHYPVWPIEVTAAILLRTQPVAWPETGE